jgi:hypothetical protein
MTSGLKYLSSSARPEFSSSSSGVEIVFLDWETEINPILLFQQTQARGVWWFAAHGGLASHTTQQVTTVTVHW